MNSPELVYDEKVEELVRAHGKVYERLNGDVIKLELDTNHFYYLSELGFVPGVTSIIDEAGPVSWGLRNWWQETTKDEANETLKTAGDFGSKMHDVFERLLLGLKVDAQAESFDTRAHKTTQSFFDWFNLMKPTEFQAEQVVASTQFYFAGTLDFLGLVKRSDALEALKACNGRITKAMAEKFLGDDPEKLEWWLIDFKTSKALHYSHEIQVAAYRQAVKESLDIDVDHIALLRLGTKHASGFEFRRSFRTLDEFLNIYNTYLSIHGGKIPEPTEIITYPQEYQLLGEINEEGEKNG